MNTTNLPLAFVIISAILIVALLLIILKRKTHTQLQKVFSLDLICVLIIAVGVILQEICAKKFNINPMFFEYFIYIGTCFLPVCIYFTGLIFANTKITFKPRYLLLFIIPIITLCILWTNDYHHLFYENYSTNLTECTYGPYLIVHNIYTYALIVLGLINLLKFSFKNSGFFSKQSLLIIVGISVPLIVNLLGVLKIISMTVYLTPISFTLTMLCCAFAIFKFDFLGIAPIALQTIADRISDSYLVIDETGTITDFNKTFITTFKISDSSLRGKNLEQLLVENNVHPKLKDLKQSLKEVRLSNKTLSFEQTITKINKTFTVEINAITSSETYLGTLILLKDITQHKKDIAIIKNNQDMLMESERLASLGQLIGGIAHNLKTPIMSISGAAEGLTDLVKEMDMSIGNPIVTNEDFHEIANDMNSWLEKIKSYTEYMSDIITAVKGQAVTLSNDEITNFTIVELFKRVDILMKHELKKYVIYLNSSIQVPDDIHIKGDVNSLVQVLNNMISNAIQSYNGKTEQFIDLIAKIDGDNVIITVKDYGCGLPEKVKSKLFKQMITTKGKNGTGLGLYMSYSTIRAHFGGNITVESEEGKGSTFNVILPIAK